MIVKESRVATHAPPIVTVAINIEIGAIRLLKFENLMFELLNLLATLAFELFWRWIGRYCRHLLLL